MSTTNEIPRRGPYSFAKKLPSFVRDPFKVLEHIDDRSGISLVDIGTLKAITVHHPEHADYILRKNYRNFTKKGPFWESLRELLGNGLSVSEGPEWKQQRQLIQPLFQRDRVDARVSSIVAAIDEYTEWPEVGGEWTTEDIGKRITISILQIVSETLFGVPTSQAKAEQIIAALHSVTHEMIYAILGNDLPAWVPLPGRKRFLSAIERIHRHIDSVILSIRERQAPADKGFLDDLVTVDALSDEELRSQVTTLLLAGYDTTSMGLMWSLHFISLDPHVAMCVRDEADAIGTRSLEFADLQNLQYSRWVMKESLRLYPPTWWLPRTSETEDEIGGYYIPANTVVAPIVYTIHRHPDFWDEPLRFKPERFESSLEKKQHPGAWLPFGDGPRRCIGQELALMEAQLILTRLAQRYEIHAIPGQIAKPKLRAAVRPGEGIIVRIRRRKGG